MSASQEFSLAILSSNEDGVLLLKPYCKTCATAKLDVIRFCSISTEDAKDLVKNCGVRCVRVKCDPSLHPPSK